MGNETFGFEKALELLKAGKLVAREGWNGKGMWLGVQRPDEGSVNKKPYIWMLPVDRERFPWTPSQIDLFGEDWFECVPSGVTNG